jgi:hypothetical protein
MNLPGGAPGAQNFLADLQDLHDLGFAEHLDLAATNRALRLRGRHGSPERLAAHCLNRYFDSSFRNSFSFGTVNNSGVAVAFISTHACFGPYLPIPNPDPEVVEIRGRV